ncbi:MAG: hypothetical protein J0H89_12520, partial [Rhizobiales bacterium]|nr:hypothetical protein [Hyphomicrobiales bacterium]
MTDDAAISSCAVPRRGAAAPAVVVLPIAVAAAVGVLLLLVGGKLLNDPDTLWQVTLGNWIIGHRAVPTVDTFSWTFKGVPWISTQWLAQVLLAQAHTLFGWAGPVLLTALAAALALALLARFLLERLAIAPVLVIVTGALLITAPHLVARPHVLALPVMVAWTGLLVRAADRGVAPPLPAVLLMALWANLHGGFILGLALIAPLGLDATVNAERSRRAAIFAQWFCFGLVATVAACANPYGVDAILAALRIVGLGGALALIGEWKPQDFSTFSAFEGFLLFAIGFALLRGFTLSPLRIVILLAFVHMALSHARSGEILGLLAPLLIAAPLARHLGSEPARMPPWRVQAAAYGAAFLVLISIGFVATGFARYEPAALSPDPTQDDRIRFALDIWQQSTDPRGTVVERYLAGRGLDLDDAISGNVLRHHPSLRYDGSTTAGMVALYRDIATNAPCGIHRTFLNRGGRKLDRKMLGRAKGAAIKLDDDVDVTLGLTIGEGIETTMSARVAGLKPAWALGSADAIAT